MTPRPRRRRAPSIASARRLFESRRVVRGLLVNRPIAPWAVRFSELRLTQRPAPGQRSDFAGSVQDDLKRAVAIFDAHYLGTATVRGS